MAVFCQACDSALTDSEAKSGVCPVCRKPLAVAGPKQTADEQRYRDAVDENADIRFDRPARPQKSRILLWILAFVGVFVVIGVIAFFVIRSAQETSRLRAIVNELRPLAKGEQPNERPFVRQKILVWDDAKSDRVDLKLESKDREVALDDDSFTVILIVKTAKVSLGVERYDGFGTLMVYREDASIAVFDWPEKKFLGKYVIKGSNTKPMMIYRKRGDKSPVINRYTSRLQRWIRDHSVKGPNTTPKEET